MVARSQVTAWDFCLRASGSSPSPACSMNTMVAKVFSRDRTFVNKARLTENIRISYILVSRHFHLFTTYLVPRAWPSPLLFQGRALCPSCGDARGHRGAMAAWWLGCAALTKGLLLVDPSAGVTTGLLCDLRSQRNKHCHNVAVVYQGGLGGAAWGMDVRGAFSVENSGQL